MIDLTIDETRPTGAARDRAIRADEPDGAALGDARDRVVENAIRAAAPQVLAALVRRYGDFDACEDSVQEALLAAARAWPREGMPANPAAWLTTVAGRRRIEQFRADAARRRREEAVATRDVLPPVPGRATDDTLTLFVLCCHPSLTPAVRSR